MKKVYKPILVMALMFATCHANSQVTNLKVNGASSNFTFVQGDTLKWEYGLPPGGSAAGEIWIDLNANGVIDPLTDKLLFGNFTQTDGDPGGGSNHGPGDMDSAVNGHIYFAIANAGVAPAHYILRFTNNTVSQSITGIVTPLSPPVYTISGAVTPPQGKSAQNILVATNNNENGTGWMALTNASGNYTINFNASASGQSVDISVQDQIPPYTAAPSDTTLTLSRSYTGVNFTFIGAAAKVAGYLKGDNGHVFANAQIESSPQNSNGNNTKKSVMTDANGFFELGYSASDISSSSIWQVEAGIDQLAPAYVAPVSGAISIHQGDSLRVDLTAYATNDSITGTVTIDGHAPDNHAFSIFASAGDSGQTRAISNPTTGAFTLYVTNKISSYYLGIETQSIPAGYGFDYNQPTRHSGDRNVVIPVVRLAWLSQTSNTGNSLKAISFVNATTGWVAGTNGIVLHTSDGGATWSGQTTGTGSDINGICFVNPSTGWFVGAGGVVKKTTDGGGTWTSQNSTTSNNLNAVQFIDANHGWAACSGISSTKILKTTDGGGTWTAPSAEIGDLFTLSFMDADTGWAAGNDGIVFKTTDGGQTWNGQNSFLGCSVNSIHFVDAHSGWAVSDCNGIFNTTDGGSQWTPQQSSGACNNELRSVYFSNATTGWIVGGCGFITATTSGGSTWSNQINSTQSNLNAVQFVDSRNGWAVGENGTILHDTSGIPTGIRETRPNGVPDGFSLEQNYPNPFNPTTDFKYRIADFGFVTLKIFDPLGRMIATVQNGLQNPGEHSVRFDGSHLASGVYFYRLDAASASDPSKHFTQTRSMVLVK